jgi:hypothetical protein
VEWAAAASVEAGEELEELEELEQGAVAVEEGEVGTFEAGRWDRGTA